MIREINEPFESNNSELLETVYLPAKDNANIKDSKAFKILKENNQDVSQLFTGEKNEMYQPIEIDKYEEKNNKSLSEKYIEPIKEFGNTLSDFVEDSIVGDVYKYTASGFDKEEIPPTAAILANNVAEFGVNLLPIMDKMIDFTATAAVPEIGKVDVFNNDKALMEWSGEKVQWFRENREHFKKIQEDDNMAAQFANLVVQDSLVSIPLYEALNRNGVGKKLSVFLAFGLGSAIAIEKKIFGVESTFLQEYGKTEITALKKILNILPNTPVDDLADEVIQTFEYTAFAFAIPQLIKTFKFLKLNAASFAVAPAVAGVIEGQNQEPPQEFNLGTNEQEKKNSEINLDDQSAIPGTVNEYGFEKTASLKGFISAFKPKKLPVDKGTPVFSSAVKQAVENIAEKGSGEQILGTIKNIPTVKANEIKWIGLDTFLQGKKSVTKKEVIDFVNQNSIDVNEVKFGGDVKTTKLSDDLEFKKNEFESKWYKEEQATFKKLHGTSIMRMDMTGPNYDVYKLFNKTDGKEITVDFNAMDTYFGDEIVTGKIKANELFSGPEAKYTMSDLEIEKYKVENATREFRNISTISTTKAPKFEQYTEAGGKDYTELVFTIKKGGMDVGIPTISTYDKIAPKGYEGPVGFYREKGTTPYKSSHMRVKSEIAHVRFKTRTLDNGMKVLAVEEMQSDFGLSVIRAMKQAKDKNLKTDFPFKNTWYELTIKRLIRYAADNGFDAVAIPKGSVAAARYGQKIEPVNRIEIQDLKVGVRIKIMDTEKTLAKDQKFQLTTFDKKDDYLDLKEVKKFKESVNVINKQFKINFNADDYIKRLSAEMKKGEVTGEGLEDVVFKFDKPIMSGSGLGKHQLYDKAIPSFMKKYSKKWNAKVYDDSIEIGEDMMSANNRPLGSESPSIPVTILEITPSMKKSVKEQGQSLFEILGIGAGAGIAAESVSDNIQNNTISN